MVVQVDLKKLRDKSRRNRSALAESRICGCFHCLNEYPFAQITEWIDDGNTAICPFCGIDAVLGFETPTTDAQLLSKLHERWFGSPKRLTPEEWQKALETDTWEQAASRPGKT